MGMLSCWAVLQASGKFDLKEPYYRQLNPRPAAAWPTQDQAAEQQGHMLPQQQQAYMDQGLSSAGMQQAAGHSDGYGWAGQQASMQQHPGLGRVSQDSGQQYVTNQWGQQQAYPQQWQ